MNELIEAFLSFKQHNAGRSERTVAVYRLALSRLVEFFAGRNALLATHDDLVVFAGIWLHKRGLTDPLSRRPHVAAVREFYRWLLDNKHVPGNAAAGLPYPSVGRKDTACDDAEECGEADVGTGFQYFRGGTRWRDDGAVDRLRTARIGSGESQ